MQITIFKDIILNTILIIFPILLYLLLSIYKDNVSNKYNNLILSISLLTSLYLCLRFGIEFSNNKILLFCNIPITISYIKKKTSLAITLSILNILYCYQIDHMLLITLIKYISYFLLYVASNKKKLSVNSFILSAAVLQGFFLSFEYFFINESSTINDIIVLLILVFVYYFITFLSVYIFRVIEKVSELNTTIKTLKKDKQIKEGLFKLTHEIKNPLAVCKGYLEMIDLDKKEKSEKYLSIMQEEINRSLNIITDFVEFNKIKISKQKISINTLLEDIYSSFKIISNTNNIKLKYIPNKDININADYDRIKQVIINLIKNSIESIDKKGIIEISKVIDNNYVKIIVKDNGIGMNIDTQMKIKEMFYTTKENGTGLGVSLSNEIIEAHNGKLDYESKLGCGTTAIIKLPIE